MWLGIQNLRKHHKRNLCRRVRWRSDKLWNCWRTWTMSERRYTCASCNAKTTSVTSIPKFDDENERKKFLDLLQIPEENVTKNTKVCRSHFLASDFGLKKLNKGAMPSQNLPVRVLFIHFLHVPGVPTSSRCKKNSQSEFFNPTFFWFFFFEFYLVKSNFISDNNVMISHFFFNQICSAIFLVQSKLYFDS